MQEIIIRKHWFGAFYYFVTGLGVMLPLLYVAWFAPFDDPGLNVMVLATAIIVGLATAVLIYAYTLNYIVLNDDGVTYHNYKTLFFHRRTNCDWTEVQDVSVRQSGVFAGLFGFGDLMVQTAGALPNLSMRNVEQAHQWSHYIDMHAVSTGDGGAG